jgi:hypothetical protein
MDTLAINKEWQNRPSDQRFLTVPELHVYNESKRAASRQRGVALDHLRVRALDDGDLALVDPEKGTGAVLTHWAFGQLAGAAKAPAGYLRTLPAELAQIPLQYSLEQQREDAKLLLRHAQANGGAGRWSVEAITSDTYSRIYDAELTSAILEHLDLEAWKVPAASYAATDPKKATTLYASDRDCFVCLVDDQHPIEVPGTSGVETLFRGLIARNSEVGAAAFEVTAFLYRRICDNRIIWGGREVRSLKIRHTSGGPMRYLREARPAIQRYLTASTDETVAMVRQARAIEVGRSEKEAKSWLKARGFTQGESRRAIELAAAEPGANPRSVWSLVQGLTAQAHEVPFGDERLDLERRAARLLDAVEVSAA